MTDKFKVHGHQVNKYFVSHYKDEDAYYYTLIRNEDGVLSLYGENNLLIQSSVPLESIKDTIETVTNWHLDTLNIIKDQLVPEYVSKAGKGFY